MVNMPQSPLLKVSSVSASPQSILPKAIPMSGVNYAEEARKSMKQEGIQDQQRAVSEEERQLKRQREAYQEMIKNPAGAKDIAQMYGVTYDQNIERMLQNPQAAQMILDGATMAKGMGITDPVAAQTFTKAYLENGGNVGAAQKSVEGMNTIQPDRASYSNLKTLRLPDGGSVVVDMNTGSEIYKTPAGSGFKIPPGYMSDEATGGVKAIPGYAVDPLKDPSLPIELQLKIKSMNNPMADVDPAELAKQIQEFRSGATAPIPTPPQLPSISGLDGMPTKIPNDIDLKDYGL